MATISKPKIQVKRGGSPDETRPFAAKGHAEMHMLAKGSVMRGVFEPGWKWSEHVGPIAGTKSCQARHLGYIVSGRMKIVMDDGTEADVAPGDFIEVEPGHDAWVVGEQPCVVVDFGGYGQYAQSNLGAGTQRAQPQPTAEPRRRRS